jgi:hypothetical protein
MELADGKKGVAIDRLKKLTDQIEEVKHRHQDRLEQKLKADLDQLKQQDSETLKRILDEYR